MTTISNKNKQHKQKEQKKVMKLKIVYFKMNVIAIQALVAN